MSQTSKILMAVVITAGIVGIGVYFWQKPKLPEQISIEQVEEKSNVIYKSIADKKEAAAPAKDSSDTLEFIIADSCRDYLSVTEVKPDGNSKALKDYSVYVSGSKQWSADQAWFGYSVFSPKEYNKMDPNPADPTIVARPTKILALRSGLLVTRSNPQDGPGDLPEGCGLNSITVKEK